MKRRHTTTRNSPLSMESALRRCADSLNRAPADGDLEDEIKMEKDPLLELLSRRLSAVARRYRQAAQCRRRRSRRRPFGFRKLGR